MPARKAKATKTQPDGIADAPEAPRSTILFPFASYTSVTGVHTSALAFTALFLPRTSVTFLTDLSSWNGERTRAASDDPQRVLRLLTENPVRTVAWMCVGALVVQAWWAGWLRAWTIQEDAHTKAEKDATTKIERKMQKQGRSDPRLAAFGNATLTTLAASVAFHISLVLFGAPIVSHPLETYSLGLLLALLTTFTPAFILGAPSMRKGSDALVSRLTWIRLFAELAPRSPLERAIVYPAVGTLLGCWLGAVPIGLDWERPWQAWPLPPAYGAIAGYIIGALAALVVSAVIQLADTYLTSPSEEPAQEQPKNRRQRRQNLHKSHS